MDLRRNFTQLTAAPIFAAILVVSLLYFPSLATLWKKWILWDQDLAHALPTIGVMLVLLGRKTYHPTEPTSPGYIQWLLLIALGICSLGWYFFESLSISLPAHFMLIATLCLFIGTTFSTSLLLAILPTLGLLIFTVPIWSELTGILVNLSSTVVGHAVKLSNVTVLIDGSSLFLPSGTIYIADGCSGIRYLIISILMGYILILINQYRLRAAITTLIAAIVLGLIANWLRIYLLVLIGYHSEMQSSLMHDHETFGWILFACLLMPAIYFSPVSRASSPVINIPKQPHYLPLAVLAIGPLLLHFSSAAPITSTPLQLTHLDQYKTTSSVRIGTELRPGITLADKRTVELERLDIRVDLFTNIPQGKREEIVPFITGLTDRSEWLIEQFVNTDISEFEVAVYKKVGGNARIIIAKQYIVGTMQTDSYTRAKFMQIIAKTAGNSYFGLLTAQANCKTDCKNELEKMITSLPKIALRND
jgi:exosortase